ncbi:MAG TPA: biotin--[acetyl-CoA-carboxylase] ligase, partial [Nitrososphaeraceae archaeon]|nr:biotin--[acetyl-CoA-carboxylase] ligase [Nitrososphaeraceae archaeon]
ILYYIIVNIIMMDKDYKNINLQLENRFIGKRIYHYKRIRSTQQLAISFAETNITDENGTVILADEQYDGKGRGNKKWISPKGGLWMSLIIKPRIELDKINILSLIAAISVCQAINETSNLETRIKWPNDIVIDDKKIAGIIIDSSINDSNIDYVVIGIGINMMVDIIKIDLSLASSDLLPQKVTSIQNENKEKCIDRFLLLKQLLKRIEYYLFLVENEKEKRKIIEIYKKLSNTLGKSIYVYGKDIKGYYAIAKDMDLDGGLILKRENKILEKIYCGEISIREKEK